MAANGPDDAPTPEPSLPPIARPPRVDDSFLFTWMHTSWPVKLLILSVPIGLVVGAGWLVVHLLG